MVLDLCVANAIGKLLVLSTIVAVLSTPPRRTFSPRGGESKHGGLTRDDHYYRGS